jgi:hypothetical protein
MRRPDFDVFIDKFKPIERPGEEGSYMYETYGEEYKMVQKHLENFGEDYIFTIVETGNGKMYAVPGFWFVNRFGYILTTLRSDKNTRDYLW